MNEPVPEPNAASRHSGAQSPERALDVLVVDDCADSRELLRRELEATGMRVRTAADGATALREIERERPEALLLDVLMPGLDGFQTCERLRRSDAELPVVFMTGLGETEHIVRGFEAGANDYVTKPVSIPEVIARLASHARTARLVRATREALHAEDRALLELAARHGAERDTGLYVVPASGATGVGATGVGAAAVGDGDAPAAALPIPLTARESEVLLWVARGKTNRDIAEILGMSPRTVNKHLEHVFEKLGVETRTAAAAAARRLKLA
ncbi:MAG: response regulator [Burkholderiales bacterium]|nr:response regulator [Burkholderiales bacterium]